MHNCTYGQHREFEWDGQKATSNLRKHGIDFADAATVFADDAAVTIRDDAREEERFLTLGMDALGRILVVACTWRGNRIRILSARKSTPSERNQYIG